MGGTRSSGSTTAALTPLQDALIDALVSSPSYEADAATLSRQTGIDLATLGEIVRTRRAAMPARSGLGPVLDEGTDRRMRARDRARSLRR